MVEDRRNFQRVGLDSPVSVLLDDRACGAVLDLSEQGLAVSGPAYWRPGEVLPFAFDLPEGGGRIHGSAKIVWKDESAYRMGLYFQDLADRSREQLMNWVSARVYTMWPPQAEEESREPVLAMQAALPLGDRVFEESREVSEVDSTLPPAPHAPSQLFEPANLEPEAAETLYPPNQSSRVISPIGLVLSGALLLLICVYAVHFFRGVRNNAQAAATANSAQPKSEANANIDANTVAKADVNAIAGAAPKIETTPSAKAEASAPAPAVQTQPMLSPISSQAARLEAPGFILQVGAMSHQANADALAADLRKNNYPAFVYSRGSDGFYRVAVGPFRDEKSPVKTKAQLEKRGLKPFLRAWAPE